ncbi:MAG: metal ABC transporter permease [Planctomycetota bacterium]|nr:metal ABC transporter permease [Planctomycetota bacterium]
MYEFVSLDLLPLAAGILAALTCGLLGNFLILRRLSLMGDAISHSVLPGLVIAFLVTQMRTPLPMFVGAAIAGVATVVLVELIRRLGRVEPGAAMGVSFSVLFALGVLLIEQAAARHVDLDADCVLYGQLELLFWLPPQQWSDFLSASTLSMVPRQVTTLVVMAVLAVVFVALFFKELRISAFDPELSTSQGIHAGVMHYMLMVFVAAATVASFEAVGSILVIAMLICPGATARLLTDRLLPQVVVSCVIAIGAGAIGYWAAIQVPELIGLNSAVNAAGSIALVAGGLLIGAVILSPAHGVLARVIRRRRLAESVRIDDLLATLFRGEESGRDAAAVGALRQDIGAERLRHAIRGAERKALVLCDDAACRLTEAGRLRAKEIVRRHRLWESYLVDEAGVRPDHVHETAERLEHLGVRPVGGGETDPHGRPIPDAS